MELFDFFRWDIIWNYRELYVKGIWATIVLTVMWLSWWCVLWLFLGFGQVSNKKWIYWPCKIYVDVFRGTPMLVQLLLIHLLLFRLFLAIQWAGGYRGL